MLLTAARMLRTLRLVLPTTLIISLPRLRLSEAKGEIITVE